MRLRNTSNFTDAQVREIIDFVKPRKVRNFELIVKPSKHSYSGKAYPTGYSTYRSTSSGFTTMPTAICKIGIRPYPLWTASNNHGYIRMLLLSREECLVMLIAHELKHLWQARPLKRHPGRPKGARGKYSEREADCYAYRMVRSWRKLHNISNLALPSWWP